ncbi:EAL domain-containing protein [Vibrio profundum]|uniref:two-component system response regulator n=1 Tax=Vibrio profundum TaxID=2910247 RepID=UPI003D0BD14D
MAIEQHRIRTLQVEDNPGDCRLLSEYLHQEQATDVDLFQVSTLSEACQIINKHSFDVALLDLSLPDACELEAVHAILKCAPQIAIVVVSSLDDEVTALKALKSGAQDYIVKGRFDSYVLHKSIRYALERKIIKDRLSYLAQYDSLTGLLNRGSFLSRVSEALERSKRNNSNIAVFFIDMDKFKQINDTLGHAAGDELLQQVTKRFQRSVRKEDYVARLAGDEFAMLLESMNSLESTEVVTNKLFALMQKPFLLNGKNVEVSISVGITVVSGGETSTEESINQADTAMYKAKKRQWNSVHYYDNELEQTLEVKNIFQNKLNTNLNSKMLIEFQPIVNTAEKILGVEALLRWDIPSQGIIYPEMFLPFLEDSGRIVQCGNWVLFESCRTIKNWYDQHVVDTDFYLCVNISIKQLLDADFISTVEYTLEHTQFPVDRLMFDVSESTLFESNERCKITLEQLKQLNISITIDHFGTSYSSLQYISQPPIEQIKIDRTFVQGLPADAQCRRMVNSIIALANSMGKSVIAEGVETEQQQEYLTHSGCNTFQGYLFSRPVSESTFLSLYNRKSKLESQKLGG